LRVTQDAIEADGLPAEDPDGARQRDAPVLPGDVSGEDPAAVDDDDGARAGAGRLDLVSANVFGGVDLDAFGDGHECGSCLCLMALSGRRQMVSSVISTSWPAARRRFACVALPPFAPATFASSELNSCAFPSL